MSRQQRRTHCCSRAAIPCHHTIKAQGSCRVMIIMQISTAMSICAAVCTRSAHPPSAQQRKPTPPAQLQHQADAETLLDAFVMVNQFNTRNINQAGGSNCYQVCDLCVMQCMLYWPVSHCLVLQALHCLELCMQTYQEANHPERICQGRTAMQLAAPAQEAVGVLHGSGVAHHDNSSCRHACTSAVL